MNSEQEADTATVLLEEAIRGFFWERGAYSEVRGLTPERADKWTEEIMEIVSEHLGTDHYVSFDETGWFVEHSFACRLAGTLGTCKWNEAIRMIHEGDVDPTDYGRWRITNVDSEGLPSLERAPYG